MKKFKNCAIAVQNERQYDIVRKISAHLLREGISLGAFRDDVAAGVWLLGTA
jgi:hypothetical protein